MQQLRKRFTVNTNRYWEIDTFRGVAIILMVLYHFTWDLVFFGFANITMTSGFMSWLARGIATMFMTAMGISLVVSTNRAKAKSPSVNLFSKVFRRGAQVFFFGLIVTAGTYFFLDFQGGSGFVIFGILHSIGFAIMASYPFIPSSRRWLSLVVGLILIGIGIYLDGQGSTSPWLIWLGLKQYGRSMVDYYPVLPWYGVALVALFVGNTLYPNGIARIKFGDQFHNPLVRGLSLLGQNSLLIYVIHQPILVGLLTAYVFLTSAG